MPSSATSLRRSDIRQQFDRATGSTLLRYVGNRLRFTDDMYGYPDGTFFAAAVDEVPVPTTLAVAADKCGVDVAVVSSIGEVKAAVLDVLLAEAMENAPSLLADLGARAFWPDWELRELERKHVIAVSRLVRLTKLVEGEISARSRAVRYDPGPLPFALMPPPPPVFPSEAPTREDLPRPPRLPLPETEPSPPEPLDEPEEVEEETEVVEQPEPVGSQVAERVAGAIRAAREAELAQRLPHGARRRLRHFDPAVYVAQGEALDPRVDLAHAMADAQSMSKRRGESTVIDWDGEWPVVVRRYGPSGCTLYKVEEALRRAGVDVE